MDGDAGGEVGRYDLWRRHRARCTRHQLSGVGESGRGGDGWQAKSEAWAQLKRRTVVRRTGDRSVAATSHSAFAARGLGELEIGVAFDEFFGAVIGEADGEAAVLAFAFDADDGAQAVAGVADAFADERILFCGGAR